MFWKFSVIRGSAIFWLRPVWSRAANANVESARSAMTPPSPPSPPSPPRVRALRWSRRSEWSQSMEPGSPQGSLRFGSAPSVFGVAPAGFAVRSEVLPVTRTKVLKTSFRANATGLNIDGPETRIAPGPDVRDAAASTEILQPMDCFHRRSARTPSGCARP